ncbi:sorting nexin Mvp1 [Myriangium duriaei CBS 260.36]|uniref:Sorting nexin MVP1 n=1 Tax=Myriangium duriaei CBS 260.36 TaxID=1168546 RepID=A0A9P4ITJ7_9PEZI|nr:sorting nexin Mvp1 [Myriangium duriaei CBS 260.36]
MSLFGESPPKETRTKSSLFDDRPAAKSNAGLFADDGANGSPWDMPTPKKNARKNYVKSLLASTPVPDKYIEIFDALLEKEGASDGTISIESARDFVSKCKISSSDADKILQIVTGGGASSLGRSEFNVLLALVGLAQEQGDELSLDAVDERKKKLPVPNVPELSKPKPTQPEPASLTAESRPIPSTTTSFQGPSQRGGQPQSFGALDSDPWGSPALHKGHDHTQQQERTPSYTNGTNSVPKRTTSTFTTSSIGAGEPASSTDFAPPSQSSMTGETPGWGGDAGFTGGDAGFGSTSQRPSGEGPAGSSRPLGAGNRTGTTIEEEITVNLLDEKEGVFLFQHRNYEVASTRKNSKVIRRYSDFVWLLDCLHKRYPFRQLPLLPPKRVAINGNHLAGDASFLEKRRRGLARFANALVRHPVLGQEQLVVMFLTVPTELAVWRKQATISVQEEFTGKSLPSGLEDSLPAELPQLFDTVRAGIRRSAEIYINLCNMVEKLAKYNAGLAGEYMRLSSALEGAAEASEETYAIDTNDVPLLNEGIKAVSKHLSANRALLEDEGRAWDLGALEDFKRQRDCLVSMRDLFDRRDRYAKDNIPQLERRIENNQNKLSALRAKPEGSYKPSEVEKLEDSIIKDKQSIVDQHARGVFIKECIRDELQFFNKSQYHVSRLHQDWSQERVKYSELGADNWRGLADEVDGMPTGE